jgi:hypothetical protein
LTLAGASFALVGGLAVSARTEPRFTRDADLAVAIASDAEAEALIRRLAGSGYGIDAIVDQDAVGRLATVRLTRSTQPEAPVIDLLFASSGIEQEVVGDAEAIELLPPLTIDVARRGHLIALKVLFATTSSDRRQRLDWSRDRPFSLATPSAPVHSTGGCLSRSHPRGPARVETSLGWAPRWWLSSCRRLPR